MGAVKDMVGEMFTVASGNSVDIRPTIAGEQWVIHNLYVPFGSKVEIRKVSPSNPTGVFVMSATMGLYGQFNFHCSEDLYLNITNVSGASISLSYDGVVSRTA